MINLSFLTRDEYDSLTKGKKFVIRYDFSTSPFGKCLLGLSDENFICHLSFVTESEEDNVTTLRKQWPNASLVRDESGKLDVVVDRIFGNEPVDVLLRGTPFEGKVWRELARIPRGHTVSYSDLAERIGEGRAVRAVANAVARNYVAYLVPCHRVIRKGGQVHRYRWGTQMKEMILKSEGWTKGQ